MKFGKNGTVIVDPVTLQTGEPDIFAGGDVVTGPRFAIDAIAAGKAAVADKLTGTIVKEIYVPKKIINIVQK